MVWERSSWSSLLTDLTAAVARSLIRATDAKTRGKDSDGQSSSILWSHISLNGHGRSIQDLIDDSVQQKCPGCPRAWKDSVQFQIVSVAQVKTSQMGAMEWRLGWRSDSTDSGIRTDRRCHVTGFDVRFPSPFQYIPMPAREFVSSSRWCCTVVFVVSILHSRTTWWFSLAVIA